MLRSAPKRLRGDNVTGTLVSQFEGTLDQFSGDGIMVFFNDPVSIPRPGGARKEGRRDARGCVNTDCRLARARS
jgi:class 3 adenylate cyclase